MNSINATMGRIAVAVAGVLAAIAAVFAFAFMPMTASADDWGRHRWHNNDWHHNRYWNRWGDRDGIIWNGYCYAYRWDWDDCIRWY